MKLTTNKKILILVTLLLLVCSLCATVVVSMPKSFAIWTGNGGENYASPTITVEVESIWAKYFIYEPCEVNGIKGYAIVGHKEGIMHGEMIIPKTVPTGAQIINDVTGTPNNVIKISNRINDLGDLTYNLSSLIIYENILEIEAYSFMMMNNLYNVEFKNSDGNAHTINVGEYAFYGNYSLVNSVSVAPNITLTEGENAFDVGAKKSN